MRVAEYFPTFAQQFNFDSRIEVIFLDFYVFSLRRSFYSSVFKEGPIPGQLERGLHAWRTEARYSPAEQ